VLAGELAKTQRLNNNLMQTQAAAQEALSLSHETTALYLSSFKDQGLITRLLSLPANIVKDVAQLNIVDKRDKDEIAKELVDKMSDIEDRLKAIRAQQPNGQPVVEEAKETTKSVEPVADDSSESSE